MPLEVARSRSIRRSEKFVAHLVNRSVFTGKMSVTLKACNENVSF
jgi:hypothetical protein